MIAAFLRSLLTTFLRLLKSGKSAASQADNLPPFVHAPNDMIGQLIEEYEAHRMSWPVQDWTLRCGMSVARVKGQWFTSQDQRFFVAEIDQDDADIVLVDAIECTVYYARTRESWELLAVLVQPHPQHELPSKYRAMSRNDAIARIKSHARSAVTVS